MNYLMGFFLFFVNRYLVFQNVKVCDSFFSTCNVYIEKCF